MVTFKFGKIAALVTACSLLLTACYPSGGQNISDLNSNEISQQIEDAVSKNEHLEIEAELDENVSEVPKINVRVMEWNEDKLKELFLAGRANVEYNEGPCDFFTDEKMHIYKEGKDYWLTYEPGRLTAEDRGGSYGYGTLGNALVGNHFEDFFTDGSINSLSREDALNMCTTLLNEIGITNYGEPEIYAITADKANKYWKESHYDEYKEWTVNDEIYLIRFASEYNGISVSTDEPVAGTEHGHGGYYVGSYIKFIVNKDKVFSLNAFQLFSPEYEIGENVKINCTAENALKIGADYYGSINLDGQKIKITDCKLIYVPYEQHDEKNFTLVPMWKVDAAIYGENTPLMGMRDSLFIDAQTGNTIIW